MNRIILVGTPSPVQQQALDQIQGRGFFVAPVSFDVASQESLEELRPDVIVLNMSGPDGDVLGRGLLRSTTVSRHVAVIAVVDEERAGRIDLSLGLQDFVLAPLRPDELLARVRHALWRHAGVDAENALRIGDLLIDLANYKVFVAGQLITLTYKEYELLRFLAQNHDRVFTREALLNRVWGYDYYGGARTVDVHIRRLRSKLEDNEHTFIETVRNVGYRFIAE
jgi:two-component system alkaline phosphatase synthesis response regulator PhoP